MKTVRLGVDFGTSNTVAVLELPNREPRPLLFDGSPLLPSAVAADAGGRLVVGRDALYTATIDPGSFEPHPKRCIDDDSVLLGDREVAVADLIAAVLRRVVEEAERAAGGPPSEIVLTCPAGWATGRRDILRQALPGAQLLEEPVAAANHLGDDLPVGHTAVVYDFGAGTFDASVIRRTATTGFAVLATEGLTDCGGLDIDAAIVASLSGALSEREGWSRLVEPKSAADRRASRQLWDNVRQAKEMLSRSTSTLVHVPLVDVEVPVGREQLDEAAAPVLERTVGAVKAALRTAAVDEAGAILLCGGSSRMPAVTTVLHRAFGVEPTVVDQPELAVAEGSIRRPPAAPAPADPSWPTVDLTKRPAAPPRRLLADPRLRVGAAAAAVFVAAAAVTAVFALSGRGDERERGAALAAASASPASSSGSPSPSVSYAPGVDPCLVGAWREVSSTRTNMIDGRKVQFGRVSGTKTGLYNADGTNSVVFDNLVGAATVNGARWEEHTNGWASGTFTAGNGTIIYTSWASGGTYELRRNGRRNTGGPLTMSIEPESYVCTPTTLTIGGSFYTETWTRS